MLKKLFLTTAALAFAGPAVGAVTVIGNTSARLCYEAAESGGTAIRGLGYCDEALAVEALSDRDRVATLVNRGILKMRKSDYDAAIVDFDTAISEDGQQAEAYLNKGVALLRGSTDYARAVPLFTTAIEKKTRKPELAYLGRGMAHEMNGQVQAAYRDYKQAQAIAPEWKPPTAELARFTVVRK